MSNDVIAVNGDRGRKSVTNYLSFLTAIFGLLYIVLALIGYGVSLAFESVFSVPHSQLFESTIDLIDLSSLAIVQIFIGASEILRGSFGLMKGMYINAYPVIIFVVFLSIILPPIVYFINTKAFYRKVTSKKFLKLSGPNSFLGFWFGVSSFGSVLAILQPIFMILIVVIFVIVTFALSSFTWIGMLAGKSYIDQWLVGSVDCPAAGNVVQTRTPDSITCAIVTRDKNIIAGGRVIWSTAKAIFLYTPSKGSVERVSLDGVAVETRKIRYEEIP